MRWVISLTFAPKTLKQKTIDDTGKASTNLLPNPNRPPPIKIKSSASKNERDRLRAAKFRQFFLLVVVGVVIYFSSFYFL